MSKKHSNKFPNLESVDLEASIEDRQSYDSWLSLLQQKMLQIQQAYYHQQRSAIILFEGWDAAGKGGVIRRVTEKIDPRGFVVYPIGKPDEDEQSRHYLHRFMLRLPKKGSLAIFDRSWYGRLMVEHVEGLIDKQQYERAFREINDFEQELLSNGIRIVKFFLHISPEEQLKRFEERLRNPVKRWKLTEEDLRNRKKWQEYHDAINRMFAETSTPGCPWHVIGANYKWQARVTSLRIITDELARDVDISIPLLDEEVRKIAREKLGLII